MDKELLYSFNNTLFFNDDLNEAENRSGDRPDHEIQ